MLCLSLLSQERIFTKKRKKEKNVSAVPMAEAAVRADVKAVQAVARLTKSDFFSSHINYKRGCKKRKFFTAPFQQLNKL